MACGAWALNSAVDARGSPCSEDFKYVISDIMGKHITLLTLFCLLCACAKSLCFGGYPLIISLFKVAKSVLEKKEGKMSTGDFRIKFVLLDLLWDHSL